MPKGRPCEGVYKEPGGGCRKGRVSNDSPRQGIWGALTYRRGEKSGGSKKGRGYPTPFRGKKG